MSRLPLSREGGDPYPKVGDGTASSAALKLRVRRDDERRAGWCLGFLAATALAFAAPAAAQTVPSTAGYTPADKDERGFWLQVEELEREIKTSAFVIRDPKLNDYMRTVFCRTVGMAQCAPVRIYILRTADFNAGMYPTGMMVINSGLLLRMRDEAQLAAILGHEYTHFTHRHQIKIFRDMKRKASAMAWLSMLPVGGLAATALSAVHLGMAASIFGFSREQEAEADAVSVPLMATAGYDPNQSWRVWEQLRAEQDATAAARRVKSRKGKDGGIFGSHPPTAERLAVLRTLAIRQSPNGDDGRGRYVAALRPWWPKLVDDQIKLNDFGGTEFLLGKLAESGWSADLMYARGELYRTRGRPNDLAQASEFYRAAIALPDAPAEAWRGLGLVDLRAGRAVEGRAALANYLEARPEAADRSMIEMMAGEV